MVLFIQLLGAIFLSFILVVSSVFYTFASDREALKEVRKLLDLNVIKAKGKGRSVNYILA